MAALSCPPAPACESCGATAGLEACEADTPVGVICVTVCGPCADQGQAPLLSCPEAVRRAMAHEHHTAPAGLATRGAR